VPRWVVDGYSTIFWEIEDELTQRSQLGPDLIVVQMGVGSLAAAVVRHFRRPGLVEAPRLVGVEPLKAACVLAAVRVGRIVEVPGPHGSVMAGLNAGLVSAIAFPLLSDGLDALVAVEDAAAERAMRALARIGVDAGETGAAGLAGLSELLGGEWEERARAALGLTTESRVLLLVTEGATDPMAFKRIVGRAPLT
jgi:diaminopropionate ammonia-lyase